MFSMEESPVRKKIRLSLPNNELKRPAEEESVILCSKRNKSDISEDEMSNVDSEVASLQKINFIKACEKVSFNSYFNHRLRFMLTLLPCCVLNKKCVHQEVTNGMQPMEIKPHATQGFKIDFNLKSWCNALDACQMCLTDQEYLSSEVLKDVLEIIMNAHEDKYAGYSLSYLVDRCQQILSLMFRTHVPCASNNLRKCYRNFLLSPLSKSKSTFSNRSEFECEKGFVKYCFNRLDSELAANGGEGPLVDINENIPEEMQRGVKGLHWQKDKLEIFETLDRTNRIERIIIVLQSIIELLQADLAVWSSRHTRAASSHIMRQHRPLMASVLWPDNILYTGMVNKDCRQIISMYVDFIRLGFPEHYITTMTLWINSVVQTFYFCEKGSGSDFPVTGKYCYNFALELHKNIAGLPMDQTIKILQRIQPNYMRQLVGVLLLKDMLSSKEDCILKITMDFFKNYRWNQFRKRDTLENFTKAKLKTPKSMRRLFSYYSNVCKISQKNLIQDTIVTTYPRRESHLRLQNNDFYQDQVVQILYTTFQSHIEAFNVQEMLTHLHELNSSGLNRNVDQMDMDSSNSPSKIDCEVNISKNQQEHPYKVSESYIKKYRNMYKMLQEIVVIFAQLRDHPQYDVLGVFENVEILSL